MPGHIRNLIRWRNKSFSVKQINDDSFLYGDDSVIWLGHASFFLRIQKINILIDPQFYNTTPYRRHTDNPILPELFKHIDYILISHAHADHCDKKSLQLLIKNNPEVVILSGLNMEVLFQSFATEKLNTITAEWYEKFLIKDDLEVYFVPSRHYSNRVSIKYNSALWGGFIIKYRNEKREIKTLYFGGDSGYGNHFKDIKNVFNPDVAFLGIGAFMPKWFMHPNHMSPEGAIQAAQDLQVKIMIPMHFETFNLSNEKMTTPRALIQKYNGPQYIQVLNRGEVNKLMEVENRYDNKDKKLPENNF